MRIIGEHAIVLGGSMGGLLAARVLADAYDRVTVIERDELPDGPRNRQGVPQGRHAHGLLPSGSQVLGELFPRFLDDYIAAGGTKLEDYSRLWFSPDGTTRLSPELQVAPIYQGSRPFLESHVRDRVRKLPNVEIRDRTEVAGLVTTDARDRVTGVRVQRSGSQVEQTLTADLVVDVMGRGARTPAWLEELGYGRPQEDEVVVDIRYASRLLRLRPGAVPETLTFVGANAERPTAVGLFEYEDDTWMLTVQEFGGQSRPDYAAMLAVADDVLPPHMSEALHEAEPLSDISAFRFHANRHRRYDKMRRFPEGLLVFGDAICSFNPVYGQGMSVAALEAAALRKCLRRGGRNLARRFFAAAAKPIGVAWSMAAGADLALPWVNGEQPLPMRLTHAYVKRVIAAAEHDPVVAARFVEVSAFLRQPPALMTPPMLARVLFRARRRPLGAPASTTKHPISSSYLLPSEERAA